jgi:hypothetical protein
MFPFLRIVFGSGMIRIKIVNADPGSDVGYEKSMQIPADPGPEHW